MFVRSLSTLFAFLALSCSSFAQATATIPHFACGGGWSTTVMLTHGLWYPYSTSANPWKLHFAIDVRSKDNKQIFSSLETLPNQNGTYTRRFACDSDEIETGRIDFIFFDSEIGNFGQPQRRIWPIAMFSYTKDGQTLEAGLQAQFMSGVDTRREDAKGSNMEGIAPRPHTSQSFRRMDTNMVLPFRTSMIDLCGLVWCFEIKLALRCINGTSPCDREKPHLGQWTRLQMVSLAQPRFITLKILAFINRLDSPHSGSRLQASLPVFSMATRRTFDCG